MILFEYDSMGPGKVKVVLPKLGDVWKPRTKEEQMLTHYNANNNDRFIIGRNRRPKWDEAAGGHTLNFRGRVTEKSVKNFQIESDHVSGDNTILQFGRVDKDRFTMDFCYPLSPLQAFAICLASLDGKVSDSSALNGMRKGARRMSQGASWFGGKVKNTFGRGSSSKRSDDENESADDSMVPSKVSNNVEKHIVDDREGKFENEGGSGGSGSQKNQYDETKRSSVPIMRASAIKTTGGVKEGEPVGTVVSVIETKDFPLHDNDEDDEEPPVPVRPTPRGSRK